MGRGLDYGRRHAPIWNAESAECSLTVRSTTGYYRVVLGRWTSFPQTVASEGLDQERPPKRARIRWFTKNLTFSRRKQAIRLKHIIAKLVPKMPLPTAAAKTRIRSSIAAGGRQCGANKTHNVGTHPPAHEDGDVESAGREGVERLAQRRN